MDGQHKLKKNDVKVIAANVARLSHLLTRERGSLSDAYLQEAGLREAYVVYFLPPNLQKMYVPLRELALHPARLFDRDRLRILDLGCGPGTSLLGALEFFSARANPPRIELVGVDQVAGNLKIVEELFIARQQTSALAASLKIIHSGIEHAGRRLAGTFDLIVFSNVLNELFTHDEGRIGKRVADVSDILHRFLADDGSCIIIEPALRETSRELLQVRDGLLESGFHIYSPCLYHADCPALSNPKDWCHEDIPWDSPALIQELDKLTGLRKESLKFSYLVLRKDGCTLDGLYGGHAFRVVSEPLPSKGKLEYYLCGSGGRKPVTRLNKDRTSANQAFETLTRGDVVRFEGLIDEGKRRKIGKDTSVTRLLSNQPSLPAE